jgi:hypothetical protein
MSRSVLVVEQAEYEMWCNRHMRLFESFKSDVSELNRRKSDLRLASGGNPLLLDSFRQFFEKMVRTHSLLLFHFI